MSAPVLRLIVSGAYVDQELAAEFGRIPPAFLPVGMARLYEAQVAQFGPGGPIHLTVPESFAVPVEDMQWLRRLGVVPVPVPDGLRLGESVVYALNLIAAPAGPLRLLHGDTLIEDLPQAEEDVIAVQSEGDDYSWAAVNLVGDRVAGFEEIAAGSGLDDGRPVVCGYFALASSAELVRAITRAKGDFVAGLNLYVRDRLIRAAPVSQWRDFGHIQTYFRSRRAVVTARAFNTLRIDAVSVRKSSEDGEKIRAEAAWLAGVPATVQPFTARLLESGEMDGRAFYRTEYQYAPTLAELYVFSAIGPPTWRTILGSCQDFLLACAAARGAGSGDALLAELVVAKTVARLERFARESGFDIAAPTRLDGRAMPSLLRVATLAASVVDFHSGRPATVMHGDFCFANILYNSRSGRIGVIDPRGHVYAGQNSILGDTRYDLAKLAHSVSGHYDHILAGRHALRRDGSHDFAISFETSAQHGWLKGALGEVEVDGLHTADAQVRGIEVGLFLSMLPLHADRPDRQAAFIANALRLFAELEVDEG